MNLFGTKNDLIRIISSDEEPDIESIPVASNHSLTILGIILQGMLENDYRLMPVLRPIEHAIGKELAFERIAVLFNLIRAELMQRVNVQ